LFLERGVKYVFYRNVSLEDSRATVSNAGILLISFQVTPG